ncbi:MAG: 1-(5-phosphoribosyl)-5-[(5-phosphoribosylamino)methylideneamino] imidazole-4-carboxamide isomerase [Rhodobacter sp.]|nr:1-(5-phosphoribosyl)-5-[(5-phosphoribosylamino)methylideneamino] imidazole-4-carboxamide isomerase [Rhodobacter sp.]
MILYPAIELQNGRCVSLYRGRLDEPQIWHVDPVEKAMEFAAAGAEWLHITDFDAVTGEGGNEDLVAEIIRKAGIPVQLAGGMRLGERAVEWIDRGVGRVVVGTLATRHPDTVKALAKQYPDQIVLSVDVYQGKVVDDGWRSLTAFDPVDYVTAFEDAPLAAMIVTDIDSDIEDADASLGLITGLADMSRTPVVANGLIQSLDDLSRLKYVRNVAGAMIGRALFRKTISLPDALELAWAPLEPAAGFK